MVIGIAEVEADAAARPIDAAFDGDALGVKFGGAGIESIAGDFEGEMNFAGGSVRGNQAAGSGCGFVARVPLKNEKNGVAGDFEDAEMIVALEFAEAEEALVEIGGAGYVFDVDCGFGDSVDPHVSG
ncbi:MAG TPA: hypothetical protein VKX39_16595 [Bryobacteraceae bacterium]|nr:hypothetical protein [Bryobacteraceae bacterium]